jgi:hypothetical protein
MAKPPTPPTGTDSAPGANGKTPRAGGRSGAYDPKPGAAVKGKGRATNTAVATAGEPQARRAERRPDLIKKRREEMRRMPEKRRKERLYTRIALGALAVLLVAAIAFSIAQWVRDRDLNQIPASTIHYTEAVWTDRGHDDSYAGWPDLGKHPPAGGIHANVAQGCNYYAAPVPNGNAIHSLEHGAIWITYRSDLPQEQIEALKNMAEDQSYILVSPYENQPTPIVATSWNYQINVQSEDDEDLDRFIRVFRNSRTYTPEYGAACAGNDTTM